MEEYSDLKFNGDLSFLNDYLEAAQLSSKENSDEVAANKSVKDKKPITDNLHENLEKLEDSLGDLNSEINSDASQNDHSKSDLEEMILNSGCEPEAINAMKLALDEMEKGKIIMQYKQDLIKMIIDK